MSLPIIRPALVVVAALSVGACADYGHRGYGYNRVAVGYSSYDHPYYGWYGDYYYPGVGYYVYDRRGSRHRWSDHQRRYWEGRRDGRRGHENWSAYKRDHDRRGWRDGDRREWRDGDRREWRGDDRRSERRAERRRDRDDNDRRGSAWGEKRFGNRGHDHDDRRDSRRHPD